MQFEFDIQFRRGCQTLTGFMEFWTKGWLTQQDRPTDQEIKLHVVVGPITLRSAKHSAFSPSIATAQQQTVQPIRRHQFLDSPSGLLALWRRCRSRVSAPSRVKR
jgi:hypothetical protein